MKKSLFFLILVIISCNPTKEMSNSEKEKITAKLDYIFTIDQKYSFATPSEDLLKKFGKNEAWKIFEIKSDSVDLDNQKKIKKIYSEYGYLGYDKIGQEYSKKFWITIQHADNDIKFQQKMLKALGKEIEKNNAEKSNYAMLEDRIAINLNQKQRFGSQVTYNKVGQAIPKNGLLDSLNIDNLRLKYNLSSFKEYYNEMTTSHFEMNKDYYVKQGMKEPKLYQ
ncbi:hypothetical protein DNC80_06620 [Flavobacterium sp. SOK18b]|uniref:DUF6624 domain-containing protein n=1 Tax=Flavobacterium sp. SOK18b TaxID=797900 RepID=UPI0015FC4F83|nr:DUF6624 domain-containing protein [Flavobacterium sp. SOK18b]MBB1193343.1 hypothetical protein [Flavobacterium sp. SOK18b]